MVLRRLPWILAVAFTYICCFAAPSLAAPYSQGGGFGGGDGSGGSGGSGNWFSVNDLRWGSEIVFHKSLTDYLLDKGCRMSTTQASRFQNGVCQLKGAVYYGKSFARAKDLISPRPDTSRSGKSALPGDGIAYAWVTTSRSRNRLVNGLTPLSDQIGITNTSGLPQGAQNFSQTPRRNLNPYSGPNPDARSWWSMSQLHSDSPFNLTDPCGKNSESICRDGELAPKGRPIIGMLRIWRSCFYKKGTSTCPATPIFSRAPDGIDADHKISRKGYFESQGQTSHEALGKNSPRIAGPLYGSCNNRFCFGVDEHVTGASKGTKGSIGAVIGNPSRPVEYFEQACYNGGLGEPVKWSSTSFLRQFDYLAADATDRIPSGPFRGRDTAYLDGLRGRLATWLNEGNRRSIWPDLGFGKKNRSVACQYFSEWLAVRWEMAQVNGPRSASYHISGNVIPGKIYVSQVATYDTRESLVGQRISTFVSKASAVPPPTEDGCLSYKDYIEGRIVKLPWPGKPSRLTKPAGCFEPKSIVYNGNQSDDPTMSHDTVQSQVAGQSNPLSKSHTYVSVEGSETQQENGSFSGSLLTPRAMHLAVHNPQNSTSKEFTDNHVASSYSGAGKLEGFAFSPIGKIVDPGTEKPNWAAAINAGIVPSSSNWWNGLVALQPYVPRNLTDATDPSNVDAEQKGAADISTTVLAGYGNSLQLAVQKPTLTTRADSTVDLRKKLKEDPDNSQAENWLTELNQKMLERDLKTNETRLTSVLSEDRYPKTWQVSESCDTYNLDLKQPVCQTADGSLQQRTLRLTLDQCSSMPKESPKIILPGSEDVEYCTSEAIDSPLGDGLKISDAYVVPPLPPGSQTELPAFFAQESKTENGQNVDQPAVLKFTSEVSPWIDSIQVWTLSNYLQRFKGAASGGETALPSYEADLTKTGNGGYIAFCDSSCPLDTTPNARKFTLPGTSPENASSRLATLPAGNYVVVARIVNSKTQTASTPKLKWGVQASLFDYDNRVWVSRFVVQNDYNSVGVFQPRALG